MFSNSVRKMKQPSVS